MATISSKEIIDNLMAGDGYYENDARVAQIVEYINAFGVVTWGVTWSNEPKDRQKRYELPTYYIRQPKVIWRAVTQ